MKIIYIDETIHRDYGFMLLSYVVCDVDPQEKLEKILKEHNILEFHSADTMKQNMNSQNVRSKFIDYISLNCKWGTFLTSEENRHNFEFELSFLVSKLINLYKGQKVKFCIDEGIVSSSAYKRIEAQFEGVIIQICNSESIAGIQLADLVAALCGVQMRAKLSGKDKILEYGHKDGFDPPIKAPVSYELWASLRYSMLQSGESLGAEDTIEFLMFNTKNYGFIASPDCSKILTEIGGHVFGTVYLGCMH